MNKEQELLNDNKGVHRAAFAKLLRLWVELTNEEQKAVLTVLALFLLGLAVCVWHSQTETLLSETAVNDQKIQPHFKAHSERTFDKTNRKQ